MLTPTDDNRLSDIRSRAQQRRQSNAIGGVREWSDIDYLLTLLDATEDPDRVHRTAVFLASWKHPDIPWEDLQPRTREIAMETAPNVLAFIYGSSDRRPVLHGQ